MTLLCAQQVRSLRNEKESTHHTCTNQHAHIFARMTMHLLPKKNIVEAMCKRWKIHKDVDAKLQHYYHTYTETPTIEERECLASTFNTTTRRITVWFQNRRQRSRPKKPFCSIDAQEEKIVLLAEYDGACFLLFDCLIFRACLPDMEELSSIAAISSLDINHVKLLLFHFLLHQGCGERFLTKRRA